jgi:hypothetical protein
MPFVARQTVLKAIEEAKLRSKSEDTIQVSVTATRQLQQLQDMLSDICSGRSALYQA